MIHRPLTAAELAYLQGELGRHLHRRLAEGVLSPRETDELGEWYHGDGRPSQRFDQAYFAEHYPEWIQRTVAGRDKSCPLNPPTNAS